MTHTGEKKRILDALTQVSQDCEFSYRDIATRAKAYHTNVSKLVRDLEKQGMVENTGGKGVSGNPLTFRVVDMKRLQNYASNHNGTVEKVRQLQEKQTDIGY